MPQIFDKDQDFGIWTIASVVETTGAFEVTTRGKVSFQYCISHNRDGRLNAPFEIRAFYKVKSQAQEPYSTAN